MRPPSRRSFLRGAAAVCALGAAATTFSLGSRALGELSASKQPARSAPAGPPAHRSLRPRAVPFSGPGAAFGGRPADATAAPLLRAEGDFRRHLIGVHDAEARHLRLSGSDLAMIV